MSTRGGSGIGSIRVLRPFPSRTWRGRISAGSARQPALSNPHRPIYIREAKDNRFRSAPRPVQSVHASSGCPRHTLPVSPEFLLDPSGETTAVGFVPLPIAPQSGRAADLPTTGHRHAHPATLRNSASSCFGVERDVTNRYSPPHRRIATSSSPAAQLRPNTSS
jgi:hypothetical protein